MNLALLSRHIYRGSGVGILGVLLRRQPPSGRADPDDGGYDAVEEPVQPERRGSCVPQAPSDLRLVDFGARYYDPLACRWTTPDPLAEKYCGISPYAYCGNNPVRFIDPDGREPILGLVGTSGTFRTLLNNSPRGVGHYTGQQAANYLRSLGSTEWSWSQMRPLPTQTGYFNNREGRYIYTEKGGWLDMSHFMFYAGKAYDI